LAKLGQNTEARDVLKAMQRENGVYLSDQEFDFEDIVLVDGEETEGGFEFQAVFSNSLLSTTLITTWSCFVMCFAYYGALYAFPNILPALSRVGHSTTPAMQLILGALLELPGYALAVVFAMRYARKPVMKSYMLLIGISMLLFVVGVYVNSSLLWHVSYWGIKMIMPTGFVVIYMYVGEVYPTEVRVTGGAVAMAGGRVGSLLAPLAFEWLTHWTGSFTTFFFVNGVLSLTNMPLVDLLSSNTSLSSKGSPQSYGTAETPAAQRVVQEAGA
jgi:hypothetical protein